MAERDQNPLAAGLLNRSALDVAPDVLRQSFETNTSMRSTNERG